MGQTNTIRWGIIGCGRVTEVKSGPAYQQTPGFELSAVSCRNEESLKDFASRHRIKKFNTDPFALIQDPELDAIYIATPPDSHLQYALAVAEAGKIACIEKPMATNYQEAQAILNAFESKGLPLFVAYYRRSLPRFLEVKKWLDEQAIGALRHISWSVSKPPHAMDLQRSYNWRTDPKVSPGGYFDDLASHGFDLFSYYFGPVAKASGSAVNQLGLYESYDSISAAWVHENGLTGSGFWNFGSHHHQDEVVILGSEGSIAFSIFKEAPLRIIQGEDSREIFIENPKHVQLPHVLNMARHLKEADYQHPATGKEALHANWIMDQILA